MSAADKMAVKGPPLPEPREELPLFTILVCGGRHYLGRDTVWRELDKFGEMNNQERLRIIEGGCQTGADLYARQWRDDMDARWDTYEADWADITVPGAVIRRRRDGKLYNAAAGPMRNRRMIIEGKPDLVLAFPGGDGTADMVEQARAAGIEVREIAP